MYRAVIICLIATGCLATVPSLVNNRSIRQAPNQGIPSTSVNAYNITQSPYSIPTYPVYTTKSPVQEEVTTVATPVEKTAVVESPSMMSSVLPYVKPILQVLVSVILSTSVIALVCTYTPFCTVKFLKTPEVRAFADSYQPNLNNMGTLVAKAIQKYSSMQG